MKNGISKKTVPGILRFVSVPFLNIYKGNNEKVVLVFVSILFFICEKKNKTKNCPRYFKIYKYTFLIFEIRNKQKNCDRYFRICNYTFSIFEKKGIRKSTVPGNLWFASIHF